MPSSTGPLDILLSPLLLQSPSFPWECGYSQRAPSFVTTETQDGQGLLAGTWSSGHQCLGGAWREKPGLGGRWLQDGSLCAAGPVLQAPCCGPPAAGVAREGLGASPRDDASSSTGEGPPQRRLEDEIDFLAQELARQEAARWKLTALPQPEAPHRLLEPGETPAPAPAHPPTSAAAAWSWRYNVPSLCSRHTGALGARPGPRPGPPLHSGSPHAHAHAPHLLGLPCVVWAGAHDPPEAPGRAR